MPVYVIVNADTGLIVARDRDAGRLRADAATMAAQWGRPYVVIPEHGNVDFIRKRANVTGLALARKLVPVGY